MKPTKIKISVSQDGLLPQETLELATLEFPVFQKRLLKALGFERVDSTTFVSVLPVFFYVEGRQQEIELELGVSLPEVRKQLIEILKAPISRIESEPVEKTGRKTTRRTKAKEAPAKDEKKAKAVKAKRASKTVTEKKTSARKTKGKVNARK